MFLRCSKSLRSILFPTRYTWLVTFHRHFVIFAVGLLLVGALSKTAGAQLSNKSPRPQPEVKVAKPPAPRAALDNARQGVVSIERAGRPVGLGFVLTGDGRVVTSLSVVGDGNHIDVK